MYGLKSVAGVFKGGGTQSALRGVEVWMASSPILWALGAMSSGHDSSLHNTNNNARKVQNNNCIYH